MPHEAEYKVTFSGSAGGQPLNGDGKAVLRLEKRCAGWALSMVNNMNLKVGAQSVRMSQTFGMSEADGGKTYESRMKLTAGPQQQAQRTIGRIEADGTGVAVVRKVPEGNSKIDLPKGTMFPLSHSRAVYAAALAGKTTHRALVFDAEASGALSQVIANIKAGTVPPSVTIPAALKGKKVFALNIRYFARADTSTEVRPAVNAVGYDNGVALALSGNAGGLTIRMTLVKAKVLEAPKCPAK